MNVLFVDYQNLHHHLRGRLDGAAAATEAALELVQAAYRHLETAEEAPIDWGRAYADFAEDAARHVQRSLYLLGVEPVYVPSTAHRNTTDLQLAVDALGLPDTVDTVAILTGDRDYAPLVTALTRRGVFTVLLAFREHLSARMLEQTGAGTFVAADRLLPEAVRERVVEEDEGPAPDAPVPFNPVAELPHPLDYDALKVIEENFGRYDEVYLTPLLRRLSEVFGEVEGHDPKSLIGDLEEVGAVRLERRRGLPYDYTVLLVNDEHPAVREVRAELTGTPDAAAVADAAV